MIRNFIRLLFVLQFVAAIANAGIVSKKSTFVPAEQGFLNVRPALALNTRTGESLIVWQRTATNEYDSEILARLVNKKGKKVTDAIVIANRPGSGDVSVAYNPVLDEYAVVYDNSFFGSTSSGSAIFARLLTSQGELKGDEVVVSNDSVSLNMSNLTPKIAFHPVTGGYVVVWLRHVEPLVNKCGLVGTLLTETLARTQSVKMIRKSSEWPKLPLANSVEFLPGGEKLLVSMRQIVEGEGQDSKADLFLATLNPMLKKIKPAQVVKINTDPLPRGHWRFSFAFLPDQSGILFFRDVDGIKSRKIDTQGKLSGKDQAGFNSPQTNAPLGHLAVAFSTNAKGTQGLLTATEDGAGGTTWAQLLNSTGDPVGAPVQVDRTSVDESIVFNLLIALPGKPGATVSSYRAYGEVSQLGPSGNPLTIGIVQLKLKVR